MRTQIKSLMVGKVGLPPLVLGVFQLQRGQAHLPTLRLLHLSPFSSEALLWLFHRDVMNLYERIPNNVNLSEDKKLQRALESGCRIISTGGSKWGQTAFSRKTSTCAPPSALNGRLGQLRFCEDAGLPLGIFLKPAAPDPKIGFGDNYGQPAYQKCPANFATRCGALS